MTLLSMFNIHADPKGHNRACADKALEAIREHTDYHPVKENDLETYVGDMVANLMHLCRYHNISFEDAVSRGSNHFLEEVDMERYEGEKEVVDYDFLESLVRAQMVIGEPATDAVWDVVRKEARGEKLESLYEAAEDKEALFYTGWEDEDERRQGVIMANLHNRLSR